MLDDKEESVLGNAIKIGLLTLVAAWFGYDYYRSRQPVSFRVADFGVPSIVGSIITLPVTIIIDNRMPLAIHVDNIRVVLSYLQNGQYVATGTLSQAELTIYPGSTPVRVNPTLDVRALFGSVLDTFATVLQNRGLDIKADVVMNYKGITLTKSIFKKISLR